MAIYTDPFQRTNRTHALALTATALAVPVLLAGHNSVKVWNSSATDAAFLSVDSVSATAVTNAVVPTAGSPTKVVVIPPNTAMTLTVPKVAYVSGLFAPTKSGTVYITEGRGI